MSAIITPPINLLPRHPDVLADTDSSDLVDYGEGSEEGSGEEEEEGEEEDLQIILEQEGGFEKSFDEHGNAISKLE